MFWLGAVVSLCYVPGFTGAYIQTQWPLLAVALSFDLLRTAVLPAFGLMPKHPFTAFHLAGLVFVAYAAVWIPFHVTPYAGVFGLWLVVISALSLWFGTAMTSTRELYAGLAVGGAVSSLLAVFQHFGFTGIPTMSAMPAGLYVNAVQQGAVLALIVVALASERMWVWALPLLPGLVLANSRGAMIVLAVGLLGCFVRRLWIIGAIALAAAFYLLQPLSASDVQRLFIWNAAWDNLSWSGWGTGVFYVILLAQNNTNVFFPEYAHNDFLQLAFEYGAAAIVPFSIIGYAMWRTDLREWPIVLAFCTAACFSMPLFMPIVAFLSFAAMGRVLRAYGLHGSDSRNSGCALLSRGWGFLSAGGKNLSVAPAHSTEG
jgi:hypothetical protein